MKNVDIEKLTKVTWRSPHRDSVISIPNSLSWLSAYRPSTLHPPIYYLDSSRSDAITETLFPKYLNLCFIDWTYYLFMGVQCLFGDIFSSWTMNLDDMKCINLKAVVCSMFTNPYTCALTPRSKPTESPEPRRVLYVPHQAIQGSAHCQDVCHHRMVCLLQTLTEMASSNMYFSHFSQHISNLTILLWLVVLV